MKARAALAIVVLPGLLDAAPAAGQTGTPPPSAPKYRPPPPPKAVAPAAPSPTTQAPAVPSQPPATMPAQLPPGSAPHAVTVARTTEIPRCTVFVDAAAGGRSDGSIKNPHRTIAAAVAAADIGAVICVAEGSYAEELKPGAKSFTLAGGFQRGSSFKVRDSARYFTKATGKGGSFIRVEDPGPKGNQLTAIDGFEITGYAQAIFRDYHESQRFDITNNYIHDNHCANHKLSGGGFYLNNISGRIEGNVFRNNSCGRSGAGRLVDDTNKNMVRIERNLIDGNAGTDPAKSHGGGFELASNTLRITANLFTRNTVTRWGGGLTISAYTPGGEFTTATLAWNVYRENRAGIAGGGMFCDDGARCASFHEVYDRNCGGNIYLDSGDKGYEPTIARFTHLTNVGALDAACKGPGPGVRIDNGANSADTYSFVNAIFWGNAPGRDFVGNCDEDCGKARVNVSYSMVQTKYVNNRVTVTFGDGIVAPVDPLFADPANGDFHLKSKAGRWTPQGRVQDSVTSPAIGRGYGEATENPERAGKGIELGAYGNSGEASYTR